MIQLSISAATTYVRKILDELTSVEDIGMLASPDGVDLHKLVEGFAVEAVAKVHNAAPAIYLDGITGVDKRTKDEHDKPVEDPDYEVKFDTNYKVATITMLKDTLRVISIQSKDSEYILTEFIPEESAEGRKQLNKYTRGVPDDPRVVLQKVWSSEYQPRFKYYTLGDREIEKEEGETTTYKEQLFELAYIPYPDIEEAIIMVCPKLEYHVLNEIAGMVLDALNEHDKAAMYHKKAQEF